MAVRPRRCQAGTGGSVTRTDDLRVREGSNVQADGRNTALSGVFISIWAFALVSGLVAFGLIEVFGAFITQRNIRVSLQLTTIPAVSIVAGLACESRLMRARSAMGGRHQQRYVSDSNRRLKTQKH